MRKDQIADLISALVGLEPVHFSTGSTEPRDLFDQVVSALGLRVDGTLTKPQTAQFIVESAGLEWTGACESAGGTVTKMGLQAVLEAVQFFLK